MTHDPTKIPEAKLAASRARPRRGLYDGFPTEYLIIVVISLLAVVVCTVLLECYGIGVFLVLPATIGFVGALVTQRKHAPSVGRCLSGSLLAILLVSSAALLSGLEGLACIVMAMVLWSPAAIIGGLAAYAVAKRSYRPPRGFPLYVLLFMLPGTTALLEKLLTRPPPVFAVETDVEIDAPPEAVWEFVVAFPPLPPPEEWLFRTGVAYPRSARITGAGPGAVRYCEFSTGPFVEPIEVWDAPRRLQFAVTENPAPMREWSPWGEIDAAHLHGFLRARRGEFRLTALPNGRTRLKGTTWYEHGLRPASYWRFWSDYIIHRIHLRVLHHIKAIVEQEEGVRSSRAVD